MVLLCDYVQRKSSITQYSTEEDHVDGRLSLEALMVLGQCLQGARPLAAYLSEDMQKLARFIISRLLKACVNIYEI